MCAVTAAPGPTGVRVWEVMSRDGGHAGGARRWRALMLPSLCRPSGAAVEEMAGPGDQLARIASHLCEQVRPAVRHRARSVSIRAMRDDLQRG